VPLEKDGSLGEKTGFLQLLGSGPTLRQECSHMHQAVFFCNKLFSPDLGADVIRVFHFDAYNNQLNPYDKQPQIPFDPGDGPRHMVFHPAGKWLYVITELSNHIVVFEKEQESCVYFSKQRVYLLPEAADKITGAAEIALTADAKYLIASTRFYNSIQTYRVDSGTGLLSDRKEFSSFGDGPRMFCLTPDERYLLIANVESGRVSVCPFDSSTGIIHDACSYLDIPAASSVLCFDEK
jgi:6-phosphogluconolactonase